MAIGSAEGQLAEAKATMAAAIGVPVAGLQGLDFSWPDLDSPPSAESFSPRQIQRDAVLNRLDVRRSLAQYAAAEAGLQLEISKQYPDVQIGKSGVEADVARKEYTRLKTLFQQNQNISEKALQSADGTLQTNEADVRAGEQQLNLEESVARQQWGNIATKWAVDNSPEFQRILDQREVLVQMTMPSGEMFAPAQSISLEIPGGIRTAASFVSTFPRVDPRIQGRSFLYVAHAQPGLTPGVNLLAHLSVGGQLKGAIVPTSAVVWSEGNAWVSEAPSTR